MNVETIYINSFRKFYIKLMFDIGRNDSRSAGSSNCFFNLESTIAFFCEDGKQRCSNDVLIISVNTSAKTSPICFTSHVGAGSMMHCLFGAVWGISSIASVVTSWKRPSGGTTLWWIIVCRAFIAVSRMLSTLLQKKVANDVAECSPTGAATGWKSAPTFCHRLRKSEHLSTTAFQ